MPVFMQDEYRLPIAYSTLQSYGHFAVALSECRNSVLLHMHMRLPYLRTRSICTPRQAWTKPYRGIFPFNQG